MKNIIVLLLLIITLTPSFSAKKSKKKKADNFKHELSLKLNPMYDNNILRYSDKYKERYENGEDEARFHINSFDDFFIRSDFSYNASFKMKRNRTLYFDLGLSANNYANNPIKDWYKFNAGVKLQTMKFRLGFLYDVIPDYYVRHYRDFDYTDIYGYKDETFKPFEFARDKYELEGRYKIFSSTFLYASIGYLRYYHNKFFREYDSKNMEFQGKIYHRFSPSLNMIAYFRYTKSDAEAHDEVSEIFPVADDADASYDNERFNIGFTYKLPKKILKDAKANLTYQFRRSVFSSERPISDDPYHPGRTDIIHYLSFDFSKAVFRNFRTGLTFDYYTRQSGSESGLNDEAIKEEKEFSQYRVGLNFEYLIKL